MLQMLRCLYAVGVLMSAIWSVVSSEELLELSCLEELKCQQFINASCVEGHCRCSSAAGKRITCQPKELQVNNIIGGPCPCAQSNAECDEVERVCYCAADYIPSTDRRRCLHKSTELGESCELNAQCQAMDHFSVCSGKKRVCECTEGFVERDESSCVALVAAKNSNCTENFSCDHFGPHTECTYELPQQCVCRDGYVKARNENRCEQSASYEQNCSSNTQCRQRLGVGGVCTGGICLCGPKYYPLQTPTKLKDAEETVCVRRVVLGQYCRNHEDCHQRNLPRSVQSMRCIYGECNCNLGYNNINNTNCISDGNTLQLKLYGVLVFVACFIMGL